MVTGCKSKSFGAMLAAGAVASVLAACASISSAGPAGTVAALRPSTRLQFDAATPDGALLAMQAADARVGIAEQPGADSHQEAHGVRVADRKGDIVPARSLIRLAEGERPRLRTLGTKTPLDVRARKFDLPQNQTVLAELERAEQALAAIMAVGETAAPTVATAVSDQQASDARREAECAELAASISWRPIARQQLGSGLLQASISGSGLVVTLAGFSVLK